ncbi:hypothetical protein [Kitasatospora sp. NPDC085464]|uniref:hypothetical protein n=1 Tax=Kitasatospora sp. NPDC085464 TaxID=3364063 RepID=UPI0037CAA1DB
MTCSRVPSLTLSSPYESVKSPSNRSAALPSAMHQGYVFGLSLLSEGLAYLSFGLVARWGEVVPSWIPIIGGRRVPPLAAIILATLGALGLIALWDPLPLALLHVGGIPLVEYSNGWWKALAAVATLPLSLWGPLLLALTYAYYKRRRGE